MSTISTLSLLRIMLFTLNLKFCFSSLIFTSIFFSSKLNNKTPTRGNLESVYLRLRLRAASLFSLRFTLGFLYSSCLRKSPMMPSFWRLRLKRFNALSTDSSLPTTTIVIFSHHLCVKSCFYSITFFSFWQVFFINLCPNHGVFLQILKKLLQKLEKVGKI